MEGWQKEPEESFAQIGAYAARTVSIQPQASAYHCVVSAVNHIDRINSHEHRYATHAVFSNGRKESRNC